MKTYVVPNNLEYKGRHVYNWFSNFVLSPFELDGKRWQTVEAYFAAQKTFDEDKKEEIRLSNPSKAKYLGRKVKLRPDWEEVKLKVMYKALKAKWTQPKWAKQLLDTGDEPIIEWNNWRDDFWGVTLNGRGRNHLGILLMQIRQELKMGLI